MGKDLLLASGFAAEDFNLLCGLTSWATCGSGKPREKKNQENDNDQGERHETV